MVFNHERHEIHGSSVDFATDVDFEALQCLVELSWFRYVLIASLWYES
jgi:hypothetical protein